jgi:hypothetical protein
VRVLDYKESEFSLLFTFMSEISAFLRTAISSLHNRPTSVGPQWRQTVYWWLVWKSKILNLVSTLDILTPILLVTAVVLGETYFSV